MYHVANVKRAQSYLVKFQIGMSMSIIFNVQNAIKNLVLLKSYKLNKKCIIDITWWYVRRMWIIYINKSLKYQNYEQKWFRKRCRYWRSYCINSYCFMPGHAWGKYTMSAKTSRNVQDEIRKMLQEPKQDNAWRERFVALVRELVN